MPDVPAKHRADAAPVRVAMIQMCSGTDQAQNIADASALIREAAASGAVYVQTPEVTNLMVMRTADLFAAAEPAAGNTSVAAFSALAAELGIWLHIGSMVVRVSDTKCANRAFVFTPAGDIAATYDKIHMFDVDVGGGERYRESKNYAPGSAAQTVELPWGRLGLAICYDMRFPTLFGAYASAGVDVTCAPSAFTVSTGTAHWHTLLRARAIETQTFMLAAAQAGTHTCGRETYGHSLIVSPWGEVLAEGDATSTGVIAADLDLTALGTARARIPTRHHHVPIDTTSLPGPANKEPASQPQSAREHSDVPRVAIA
ncbi:MAG: carbon-nitrogen hydrolase family protein [Pseudomonadota bacterium]